MDRGGPRSPSDGLRRRQFLRATAGGTVAARNGSSVTVGSLGDGRVHVLGSLLPPATRKHLHPFNLHDQG